MSDPDTFDTLYEHLENHASNYRYSHQISDLFKPLIEKYGEEKDSINEKKAHIEREAFLFHIIDGELNPTFTRNTSEGELKFPDFAKWDEESFQYIMERLEATKNPVLSARYAHILWESPHKHGKYAEIAIDSYLELVEVWTEKDKANPDDHYGLSVIDTIKTAYYLARNSNNQKRLKKIISKIKELLKDYPYVSKSAFVLRRFLLDLMLEEKNISVENLKDVNDIAFEVYKKVRDQNQNHQAIMMLEIGQKLSNKIGDTKHDWNRLIAEEYEKLMKSNAKGNPLAAISFYEKARLYYGRVNADKKIGELDKIYDELRKNVKYTEFKTKIDLSTFSDFLKDLSEKIKNWEFSDVIGTLVTSDDILPSYNMVKEYSEKILKENPLRKYISTSLVDERGHTADRFTSDEEILNHQILQNYGRQLQMIKRHLINTIIVEAIRNGKFTYDELVKFLKNNSWVGKSLPRRISASEEIKYSWLDVISPSLKVFFEKVNIMLSTESTPDFVLPMDSLILKIEGLIRDICRSLGVTTYFHRETPRGTMIREKDLHALLNEDKIKELFSADELFFFKYILVEQAGFNLRHKVAHSLIIFQEYNLSIMNLLLIIFLRIAKYNFKLKDRIEESDP